MVWHIQGPREVLYNNWDQLCLGNSGQARCQTPTHLQEDTHHQVSKHPVKKSKEGKLCYLFLVHQNVFLLSTDNLYDFYWCFISEDNATDTVKLCLHGRIL